MSKIFIRFIYLQGFCEAAVSNAHLRWIGGDGWWFSGHWDITNTSEEEGLSPAKCGESRGNQGNRLQRWMAISNNIQSWISTSVLCGGNLESGNILVLNIWSGLVICDTLLALFWDFGWDRKIVIWEHFTICGPAPGSDGLWSLKSWDSCDTAEILRTLRDVSSQNMAQHPVNILSRFGKIRKYWFCQLRETLSVYLCNSYRESNCQWIIIAVSAPPVYSTLASHFATSHHHRGRNVTDSWYISSLKSVFARSWSVSKQTSLFPQILPLLLYTHHFTTSN